MVKPAPGPATRGPLPRDGRPLGVAAVDVDDPVRGDARVGQPQLLALEEERRAAQRQSSIRPPPARGRGRGRPRRSAWPPAGGRGCRGTRSARRWPGEPLELVDHRAEALGAPGRAQEDEVERQMQLVAGVRNATRRSLVEEVDLAHRHAVAVVLLEHGADAAQQLVAARPVLVLAPRARSPTPGSGSLPSRWTTSMRKPSTPRSSQKRSVSCIAASTSGLAQLRSGCSGGNECRYHWPVARSWRPRRPDRARTRSASRWGAPPGPAVAPDVPVALRVVARATATPGTRGAGRRCGSGPSR